MPSILRIVTFLIIMGLLAIPMALLEVAAGHRFPKWEQWKMDTRTKLGFIKVFFLESRYAWVFAPLIYIVNPILFVFLTVFNFALSAYDIYRAWHGWPFVLGPPIEKGARTEAEEKKRRRMASRYGLRGEGATFQVPAFRWAPEQGDGVQQGPEAPEEHITIGTPFLDAPEE